MISVLAVLWFVLALWGQDAAQTAQGPARAQAVYDFAETLMAATPQDRERLLAENPSLVTPALRQFIAARASRLSLARQYLTALEVFQIALEVARAAHDRAGESETLQNIANSHYFLRDFDAAERDYQQRLALARDLNDRDGIAASIVGLATVAYSRAEYTPALAAYREALTIYEDIKHSSMIGSTLINIANVQYLQADYDEAAGAYRRAIDLLTSAMDTNGVALARSGLGRVFGAQGDIASALEAYGQVLSDARARHLRGNVAAALESIGELHYRLRNVDQARAAFQEARQLIGVDDLVGAGRLLGNIGLTELVAGRFDAALVAYSDSRLRFEEAKQPEDAARAWVGIGFSQAAREKFPEAMTAYRNAIVTFDRLKRDEQAGRAWLGLSMAQSSAGDHEAALIGARRVRTLAEAAGSDDLRWRGAVRQGEALAGLKRFGEAQRAFDEAIVTIEKLAEDAPLSADVRADLDESDTAWAGLAFTFAARGNSVAALAAEEQRRAHMRRLALSAAERDIFRGMTPDERNAEQQAARDLISARAQLRAERGMRTPDPARRARLARQLAALTSARAKQQAAIYDRLPDLRRWRGRDRAPRAEDLISLLPDDRTIALEYVASDEQLLILSITRREADLQVSSTVVPFKRRQFAALLAKALEPDALRDGAEWTRRSGPLTATLVTPVADRLADRDRIVVLPDDLLWKVPFEALTFAESDLAARATVTYATSFATWMQQAALPPVRSGVVVLLGSPDLPESLRAQLELTLPGWTAADAASSIDQMNSIGEMYESRARLLSGAEVTEPAVRSQLEAADLMYLAAPLRVSGASPLFSAVLLAGNASTLASDGRWEVREWFASNGRARLIVLPDGGSFGAGRAGGAMDTLAWAAAAAGVPALVVGRWPPAGFDQRDVILGFCRRFAYDESITLLDAWRAAVADARRREAPAPSAWSGLRLIGAG